MRKFLVLLMLIPLYYALWADTSALLSPAETGQLIEMLHAADLDSLSLCFEKDWDLSTKYKLDWQMRQLQNPWQALTDLQELREICVISDSIPDALPNLLQKLSSIAFNFEPALFNGLYSENKEHYTEQWKKQVRKPEDIFSWLMTAYYDVVVAKCNALKEYKPQDLERMTSYWMWQFIESEEADKYKAYFQEKGLPDYDSLDVPDIREHLGDIVLSQLLEAGIEYQALADVVVEKAPTLKYKNKKPIVKETGFGLIIIGTAKDDVYKTKTLPHKPICFLLDPGGNDVYEIDLRTDRETSSYLLLDMAGDDVYRNATPAGMFCSTFGYGYSYDLAGNDFYQTDDFAFSSFMGINLHQDFAGEDIYHSGLFSQGASMFGVSLLCDQAGNDTYQASVSSQGLGSTHAVGAILDQAGSDNYTLGGKYFHEPLMPLDYITLGQGMGMGLRPDIAGGLGLLYDRAGSDRYLGGVYAQGSGYWYAVGALIDETGNDVYNTVYYPQGSGIHLANGFLFDGAGDDAYYSRMGPGQGAAHDWALGMFVDAGGNDAYSIPGGNGLALTNSVAIFVDKSGDDRYERKEVQNHGSANFTRSTGGIGLFLDAGGKDAYPDTLAANDKIWQQGTYGVGRDIDLNKITKSAIEELAASSALPDSTNSIEDIFAAASEWEVGSAVQRVRVARDILLSRADEAIPYIMKNKISSDDGLEYRVFETLAGKSSAFIKELYTVIEGADSLAAKNAMSLIAGVGDSLLVEYVQRLMLQKKYVTACISVLSGVNTAQSVELLSAYIHHPSERYRYITARSLKQIKHPSARATLDLMRSDSSFLVQALLRNLPPEDKP